MSFLAKMRSAPSTLFRPTAPARPAWCATLPEGVRIYAVGDIHGRLDLLTRLQDAIDADIAAHPAPKAIEVYLGDYVDRGPDSAGVLDNLMARHGTRPTVCLCGNHEDVMVEAGESFETFLRWVRLGGLATVHNYTGLVEGQSEAALWELWRQRMRPDHVAFLRALPPQFRLGDYVFVHAGVRPGIRIEAQQRSDMLWIRNEFLSSGSDFFGHCVVHGHTPTDEPEVLAHRINIDTGAYATGRLTCLVLEGIDRFLIST